MVDRQPRHQTRRAEERRLPAERDPGEEPRGRRRRRRLERRPREWQLRDRHESSPGWRVAGEQAGPAVDVIDAPDEVRVVCDLPGYDLADIDVRGSGDRVRIEAEREHEREGRVHRGERAERVERVVDLPARVDVDAAEATYENGVLTVTLPKRAEERSRSIPIE